MNTRARHGFTLSEVLMAVAVVAILATMAMPNMTKAVERGYWRQARDVLQTIYFGEMGYSVANGTTPASFKGPLTPLSPPADWNLIFMENPNGGSFPQVEFSVAAAPGVFTAQAKRVGGPFNGQIQTMDQSQKNPGQTWNMP